ncbi:hypothetical protein H0G86_008049 [Trichoderma simmonsii]|uniref:Uncharacterized protein n=1 Tax=Trichoderma simmonsii TaxID=1491479 RepID=A0A8G0LFA0_9HYPO|nr:hypothetical protein H0G86_008049 [Trichoderma simmonsii]
MPPRRGGDAMSCVTRQPRENTMNSRPPSTRPTSFPMGRVAEKSAPGLEVDQGAQPGTAASLSSSKALPAGQAREVSKMLTPPGTELRLPSRNRSRSPVVACGHLLRDWGSKAVWVQFNTGLAHRFPTPKRFILENFLVW